MKKHLFLKILPGQIHLYTVYWIPFHRKVSPCMASLCSVELHKASPAQGLFYQAQYHKTQLSTTHESLNTRPPAEAKEAHILLLLQNTLPWLAMKNSCAVWWRHWGGTTTWTVTGRGSKVSCCIQQQEWHSLEDSPGKQQREWLSKKTPSNPLCNYLYYTVFRCYIPPSLPSTHRHLGHVTCN